MAAPADPLPAAVSVSKPTPYEYSLAHLAAADPNPLPPAHSLSKLPRSELDTLLQTTARDGAQSLITTLLTTTTIHSTSDALIMTLPPSTEASQHSNSHSNSSTSVSWRLPRWKPLPKPKAPTTWERFAKKKGIGKYGAGGAQLAEQRQKLVYDEEKGEWRPRWGYKSSKMDNDWLVEIDDDKKAVEDAGRNIRGEPRRERMERVRRQQRREKNNKNSHHKNSKIK